MKTAKAARSRVTGGERFMSIKAVTYCHLYSLQQKLLEVTHPHPIRITSHYRPPTDPASLTTVLPPLHSR